MDYKVALCRNIAIVSIVFHHTLCAFGGWPPNHTFGLPLPEFLWFISGEAKAIGLGTFTFVSGFLFAMQRNKSVSFMPLLWKKIKRILFPCLFFGIIYQCLFPSFMYHVWPAPINGTHLWYLPMILLCMIIAMPHLYIKKYSISFVLVFYTILSYCGSILGFRTLAELFGYFPIFYAGFIVNRFAIFEKITKATYKFLFLIFCLACLVMIHYHSILIYGMTTYYGVSAISMYLLVSVVLQDRALGKISMLVSKNSFAIYLIHQFVINTLLYFDFTHVNVYVCVSVVFTISLLLPLFMGIAYERWRKSDILSKFHKL